LCVATSESFDGGFADGKTLGNGGLREGVLFESMYNGLRPSESGAGIEQLCKRSRPLRYTIK